MGADYYAADTENGDHMDDPSEDGLYMLIEDLNDADNTFLTINPADTNLPWWATVAREEESGFEIVRRDPSRNEHEVTLDTDIGRIAADLTIWLTGRDFGRGKRPPTAEPVRFTLTTQRGGEQVNPDDVLLERAVAKLGDDNYFAILTRADGWFVQVGYGTTAGVAPGTYAIEHQEGSTDQHFASHTTDIRAVTRFLQEFRAGVDTWKRRHSWHRVQLLGS